MNRILCAKIERSCVFRTFQEVKQPVTFFPGWMDAFFDGADDYYGYFQDKTL